MFMINVFAITLCFMYSAYFLVRCKSDLGFRKKEDVILLLLFLCLSFWMLSETLLSLFPLLIVTSMIFGIAIAIVGVVGIIKIINDKKYRKF